MRSLAQRALLLCALAALAASARAGAPFVTDDPEPVEPGHWEVFLASQLSHDPGGWSGAAPFVDANYGAVENLQLHLLVPVAVSAPEHGPNHWGLGDSEVGAKFRFVQETENRPQVGVYPIVVLPTGDEAHGL